MTSSQNPVIIITRHPDYENDIRVFGGEATIIDVDLGSSFDSHADSVEEWSEWVEGYGDDIASLISAGQFDAADHLIGALKSAHPEA